MKKLKLEELKTLINIARADKVYLNHLKDNVGIDGHEAFLMVRRCATDQIAFYKNCKMLKEPEIKEAHFLFQEIETLITDCEIRRILYHSS